MAGFAKVRNQLAKMEGHFGSGFAHAHFAAIPGALHGQVHASPFPSLTEFIGRHGHRAEGSGRFALQEAKALGQLVRNQVAQAHVVGQHDQAHGLDGFVGGGLHGHIPRDDRDLGLKVDAKRFVGAHHRVTGAQQIIAAALVHQRVGVKAAGHLGVA